MLITFIVILSILLILLNVYIERKVINPLTIYNVIWGIILSISYTNPYGLYDVSDKIYWLVNIHLICFNLLYILKCLLTPNKNNITQVNISFSERIFKSNTKYLIIIFMGYFTYYALKYNSIAGTVKSYELRNIRYGVGSLFTSAMELYFFNYVAYPLLLIYLMIVVSRFFLMKKVDYYLITALICSVLYGLIGYGRFIYFNIIIISLFYALYTKVPYKIKSENKLLKYSLYLFIVAIFYLTVIFIYSSRQNIILDSYTTLGQVNKNMFKEIVVYFVGPLRALDMFIRNYGDGQLYGRASFSGLDELIYRFVNILGVDYQPANEIITNLTRNSFSIGSETQYFNAFFTGLFNMFLDFKLLGVIFFSSLQGWIISKYWNKFKVTKDDFSLIILVLLSLILVSNIYRSELQNPAIYIVFILLILVKRRGYRI